MTQVEPPYPAASTLKRYGGTREKWLFIWVKQRGRCPLCDRGPEAGVKFVIDHEHVRGWRRMRPEVRWSYVRGLPCARCNWRFLVPGMTYPVARRMTDFLLAYEVRRPVAPPPGRRKKLKPSRSNGLQTTPIPHQAGQP
jgi:hypothetical protein